MIGYAWCPDIITGDSDTGESIGACGQAYMKGDSRLMNRRWLEP